MNKRKMLLMFIAHRLFQLVQHVHEKQFIHQAVQQHQSQCLQVRNRQGVAVSQVLKDGILKREKNCDI